MWLNFKLLQEHLYSHLQNKSGFHKKFNLEIYETAQKDNHKLVMLSEFSMVIYLCINASFGFYSSHRKFLYLYLSKCTSYLIASKLPDSL